MDFPSKVDTWFLALFWGSALAMAFAVPFLRRKSNGAALLLGALAVVFTGIGFSAHSLRYRVQPDGVVSVGGGLLPGGPLFRIDDVISIEPSNDPRSAPAASLERMMVTHARGVVLVSPADRAGFLDAIARQRPSLRRAGLTLRSVRAGSAPVHGRTNETP